MRNAAMLRRTWLAFNSCRAFSPTVLQCRSLCTSGGEAPTTTKPNVSEDDSAGRDLAKLAKIASALKEAIQKEAQEGNTYPEILVSMEQNANDAFVLIKRALNKVGRPCTPEELADRIDKNVIDFPPEALGYKELLEAAMLRDSIEHMLVNMNVMPPAETLLAGAGEPLSRLDRKMQRKDKEEVEERKRAVEAGDIVEREKALMELRPVSDVELARRKAQLESAANLGNVLRGFDTALLEIGRVNKVVRGGTTQSMRALVVLGNRNGTAGFGEGKSDTPQHAIERACRDAKRNLLHLDLYQGRTIFHRVMGSYVKSRVVLWPARKGTGISANNNFSAVFQLFGLKDIGAKLHGPRSLSNAVKALFNALSRVNTSEGIAESRGLQDIARPPMPMMRNGVRKRKLRAL